MNRSVTTPRSYSTEQLRAALHHVGGPARPDYLPDIVAQAGHTRQRPAWTFPERWLSMDIAVRRQGVPRAAVLFAALLLVALLAAAIVYVGSQVRQPERLLGLPTTPGAWERVPIELPSGQTGRVVSLAATAAGSLALVQVGEIQDGPRELFASTRSGSWVRVPPDAYPVMSHQRGDAIFGTDRGFLLSNGDIWFSADGFDWQLLARRSEDPDLAHGEMQHLEAGGPGYVAVGNNNSTWYSTDGSDWTLAQVQPPAAEFLQSQGFTAPEWGMDGLAVAGDKLVAWGNAFQSDGVREMQIGLWWTSLDGRFWSNVPYPLGASDNIGLAAGNIGLAAGPRGFVGVFEEGGQLVFRASADGSIWEQVHSLGAARSTAADGTEYALRVSSIAASDAGFVAVGEFEESCLFECPPGEVVIWTSEDGRSWSRLPSDARFARADDPSVVAWGDRFVVGGTLDGEPVTWISE